ncbi:MAG: hypothetical protein L3J18_14405 [Candidatus Brocadia sp.]|nr:hypothetical protein [Anaerolineales bacterium]MCE7911090.1 hypothetical protein [Candidatus Brocadia sp. AMX3]UJS20077.1 MAG: hypothetical protein L3J18_14405 [Candidatus Brocadia sp.]
MQATKTFEQVREIIREALSKVKKVLKGAVKMIAQRRYRERYRESTGKDPLVCPHCGQEMDICTIWHPRYGVIYGELDEIKRGKYEQKEKETSREEGNGGPFGPAPKEYKYRCSVCGTELLVNEAIADAGIGMAKSSKEYSEGYMPKVGCPGCNINRLIIVLT